MSDQKTLGGKCPRCGVATEASILAFSGDISVDLGTTSRVAYFCRCAGCKKEFLVEQYAYIPPLHNLLEDADVRNAGKEKHSKNWEVRVPTEHVDGIVGLPDTINQFYREAVSCLANDLPNAAGAMFRKALEATTMDDFLTKSIPPEMVANYRKSKLYDRISALKDVGAIPPALHGVADILRIEGNVAVHDVDSYTIAEATALKTFCDALLNNTIVMAKLIAATRSIAAVTKN